MFGVTEDYRDRIEQLESALRTVLAYNAFNHLEFLEGRLNVKRFKQLDELVETALGLTPDDAGSSVDPRQLDLFSDRRPHDRDQGGPTTEG